MANGHGGARPGAGRKPGKLGKSKQKLAELAKEFADDAFTVLHSIAMNDKAPAAARVSAATGILDRAFGKPAQTLEHTGPGGGPMEHVDMIDLSQLSEEELEAYRKVALLMEPDPDEDAPDGDEAPSEPVDEDEEQE